MRFDDLSHPFRIEQVSEASWRLVSFHMRGSMGQKFTARKPQTTSPMRLRLVA
jgi:hypothetical protein